MREENTPMTHKIHDCEDHRNKIHFNSEKYTGSKCMICDTILEFNWKVTIPTKSPSLVSEVEKLLDEHGFTHNYDMDCGRHKEERSDFILDKEEFLKSLSTLLVKEGEKDSEDLGLIDIKLKGNLDYAIESLQIEQEHCKSGYKEDEKSSEEYLIRVYQLTKGIKILKQLNCKQEQQKTGNNGK